MATPTTQFRNTMDELNHFMVDHQLRTDHRVRIRQFFRATREFTRRASYKVRTFVSEYVHVSE